MGKIVIAISAVGVAVGVGAVQVGLTDRLNNQQYYQPWVGPATIIIGLVLIAAAIIAAISGLLWTALKVRKGRSTAALKHSSWLSRPLVDKASFFGRDSDLQAIAAAFRHHQAVVLCGGAGYGKSRLAAEYTRFSRSFGFWTTAGTSPTQTLLALAAELSMPTQGDSEEVIVRAVKARIHSLPSGTLWVVDNLENLDQTNSLLADVTSIRLLATTRDNRKGLLPGSVKLLKISLLDAPAAVALLCSRSKFDPKDPNLGAIAKMVGYLPLAIEMLAVQLGAPGQSPESLLAELNRSANHLQLERFKQTEGFSIPRPEGVFATITGTLSKLSAEDRAALSPLGYVVDAPVPVALFQTFTGLEETAARRLCEECGRQSVLTRAGDHVIIHSLTRAAIAATNPEGTLQTALGRAREQLCGISQDDPAALRSGMVHYEHIFSESRKALEITNPDVLAFASDLASGYFTLGRVKDAIKLDEETRRIRERVLGADHPDTLESLSHVARDYRALGRNQEAIKLDEVTLRMREEVLGTEHPETLRSRCNLALGYYNLYQHKEALELDEETLRITNRVLGPEHQITLASRSNLANDYRGLARSSEYRSYALRCYEKAVELDEETLSVRNRVLGPEHPDTLATKFDLAVGYSTLGRYRESTKLLNVTLKVSEQVLGSYHPSTLACLGALSNNYSSRGHYKRALKLDKKAVDGLTYTLGIEHPSTLGCLTNLAIDYCTMGQHEQSIKIFEEVLSISMRVWGNDDPDTLKSLNNLNSLYRELGREQEANELIKGQSIITDSRASVRKRRSAKRAARRKRK